jgi:hypothetical protein
MPTHQCPARGCDTIIVVDLAMCRYHWRMVPQALKRKVYQCWRRRLQLGTDLAIEAHRAAVAQAVAAVDGRAA